MTMALADLYLDIGSNVNLRCEAIGRPTPTYRWFKNGVQLVSGSSVGGSDPARYTLTANKLTINAVTVDDQGTFQCSADNTYGTAYSTANLRVLCALHLHLRTRTRTPQQSPRSQLPATNSHAFDAHTRTTVRVCLCLQRWRPTSTSGP